MVQEERSIYSSIMETTGLILQIIIDILCRARPALGTYHKEIQRASSASWSGSGWNQRETSSETVHAQKANKMYAWGLRESFSGYILKCQIYWAK